MTVYGPRFRERQKAAPVKNGKIQLGTMREIHKPTGFVYTTYPVFVSYGSSLAQMQRTWDWVNPGPPFERGDNFLSIKAEFPQFTAQGFGTRRGVEGNPTPHRTFEYTGGFANPSLAGDAMTTLDYTSLGIVPIPAALQFPVLLDHCSKVYNLLKPKLEKAGLGVAALELRDAPDMLKTTGQGFHQAWKALGGRPGEIMQPKKIADQFLNQQFGWRPFINDLRQIHDAYQNSRKYIDEITRNNNTWVRRARTVSHVEQSNPILTIPNPGVQPWVTGMDGMCTPTAVPGVGTVIGYAKLSEEFDTLVWAVGTFKFYRPEFDASLADYDSPWNAMQRYLKLYGVQCNPSTIWKATPWSWLADWFTNAGDLVQRVTDIADDQVTSKYMYLMQHHIRRFRFKGTIFFTDGATNLDWSRIAEIKQRERAYNPYNFCLKWSDLTPRQLAILASLGVSRRG